MWQRYDDVTQNDLNKENVERVCSRHYQRSKQKDPASMQAPGYETALRMCGKADTIEMIHDPLHYPTMLRVNISTSS